MATRVGGVAGVQPENIHIYHDTGPDTTATEYCTAANPTAAFGQEDRILVQIDLNFTPLSPLSLLPAFQLHSQNAHTIILGAAVESAPAVANTLCTAANYPVTLMNPLGLAATVSLADNTALAAEISEVLVVWDTTNGAALNSIVDSSNNPLPGFNGLPGSRPSYDSRSPNLSIPAGEAFTIGLNFSKGLKSDLIVRLTLNNGCVIGQ